MMNWCFIGAGRLAEGVAKEILPSGKHRIVSVYTRRPENGQRFAAQYGARAYASPEEAISAPDVQAVYIVTPHNTHYKYARLALELGKPVLLEKPFTVAAAQTDKLIALAAERKLYLAEAMWTWFSPVAGRALKWIQDGELGEITSARLTYCFDIKRNSADRLFDPARAGGALLDIGVYPITYLYRLFGKPTQIECRGTLEDGIDLDERVTMTFESGLSATADISFREAAGEELRICGSKGSIYCDYYHMAGEIRLTRSTGEEEVFRGDGGYLNEFNVAAAEIQEGLTESRMVPLNATSDVMHLLDECRRQMGLAYDCEEID